MSSVYISQLRSSGGGTKLLFESVIAAMKHKGALVEITSAQATTTAVFHEISWDAAVSDTDSFWSSGNSKRLTVPNGVAKVRLVGSAGWAVNATGIRSLAVFKNGAAFPAGTPVPFFQGQAITTGFSTVFTTRSYVISVVAGDYFSLAARQRSGGDLNLITDTTWFSIEVVE